MYRKIILLILLVGFSEEHANSGRCDRHKQTWSWITSQGVRARTALDRSVAKIASDIIKADKNIRTFCKSHADHFMKETYGMEHYKLSLTVEDFDEESISVKVMHKMVYVNADDCTSMYADIRVLPDVVDPTKGKWNYVLGELTIYFPYLEIPAVEIDKNCGPFVSTNVIVVPKCAADTEIIPDIDVRFGDTEFKKSMKDFIAFKNK